MKEEKLERNWRVVNETLEIVVVLIWVEEIIEVLEVEGVVDCVV